MLPSPSSLTDPCDTLIIGGSMAGLSAAIHVPGGQKVILLEKNAVCGLNTCWVAGTYSKGKCRAEIEDGEKLVCVITIGYGQTQGKEHSCKPVSKLCDVKETDMPDWLREGLDAVLKAPTAMNQQKFYLELKGDRVKATGKALICNLIDLGIVKYHFEIGSGKDHTVWL